MIQWIGFAMETVPGVNQHFPAFSLIYS